ncbi:MAG: histidine--tRNA ligase [Patescibacteria group bacterium]|nr:histidine--tRNA ligase [Patescibacteria group bacterium]
MSPKPQQKSTPSAGGKNAPVAPKPTTPVVRALRGFRDQLPTEQQYWNHLRATADALATGYGFSWVDTPVLEETGLFSRAAGRQSDIVTKEMYTFTDVDGDTVALRPEFTPGVVRMYLEHGMGSIPQPVKMAYFGPLFRRERPQHGRHRQFYQFGVEVIGSAAPVVDAQLVALAYRFCEQAGLPPVSIQINSLGCAPCRAAFRTELVNYYKPKPRYLCGDCKKRLVKNPLRMLDCKHADCQPYIAGAPQILDWIDDACKKHFMAVVEYLDGMEIPYVLNPYLVRGLDYYTRTVFEIWPTADAVGATAALGGGGRYDDLVALLGGPVTAAAGFAIGLDRIVGMMKENAIVPPQSAAPRIFVAQIGEAAKIKALQLYERLRQEGFAVCENFSKDSLKSQLEFANRMHAHYAIIIGQKEVLDGTVLLRDMDAGVQEIIGMDKISGDLRRKLENGAAKAVAIADITPTPSNSPEKISSKPAKSRIEDSDKDPEHTDLDNETLLEGL